MSLICACNKSFSRHTIPKSLIGYPQILVAFSGLIGAQDKNQNKHTARLIVRKEKRKTINLWDQYKERFGKQQLTVTTKGTLFNIIKNSYEVNWFYVGQLCTQHSKTNI